MDILYLIGALMIGALPTFIADLFFCNFFFLVHSLLIDHNKAKYYSMTSVSPFVSLVIFPIIGIAIVVVEFIVIGPIYTLIIVAICIIPVVLVHKVFSKSGYVRQYSSDNVNEKLGNGGNSFSEYVYGYCSKELDRIEAEYPPDIIDHVNRANMLIYKYSPEGGNVVWTSGNRRTKDNIELNQSLDHVHAYHERTFECTLEASEKGDVDQTYLAALMYGAGKGTFADTEKAIIFMNKAALAGHSEAKAMISECRFRYPQEIEKILN